VNLAVVFKIIREHFMFLLFRQLLSWFCCSYWFA